ncbi:hypothetical protein SH580_08805 [Coraliomargarita algicola]|uniref:Uncharacterized protein n=1 Tax=Coraliomargarita algicola TaxID=3092156 RepID=A0ABZ0RS51_9BACT|nr:hypothetical protein [Coraliomargarita sp. J2-16]WPJ97810.1 hypothetical protein SH580_08805 [Coraliomargarita sp. J2-16]
MKQEEMDEDYKAVLEELLAEHKEFDERFARGEPNPLGNLNRRNFRTLIKVNMWGWLKVQASPRVFSLYQKKFESMLNECKEYCSQETSLTHKQECEKLIAEVEQLYTAKLRKQEQVKQLATEKLAWELLPPGETTFERLNSAIEKSKVYRDEAFDRSRLDTAYSLNPNKIYVGQNEFSGYFAFLYPWTTKVLLENPNYGNAAYVFTDSWKTLSRLPKSKLLAYHANKVKKLIHHKQSDGWKSELMRALTSQ